MNWVDDFIKTMQVFQIGALVWILLRMTLS